MTSNWPETSASVLRWYQVAAEGWHQTRLGHAPRTLDLAGAGLRIPLEPHAAGRLVAAPHTPLVALPHNPPELPHLEGVCIQQGRLLVMGRRSRLGHCVARLVHIPAEGEEPDRAGAAVRYTHRAAAGPVIHK